MQVNIHIVWPHGERGNTNSLAPLAVRQHGSHIDTLAEGRLVAWVRRSSGAWLAVVEVPASSASGQSSVTLTLWVPPNAVKPI